MLYYYHLQSFFILKDLSNMLKFIVISCFGHFVTMLLIAVLSLIRLYCPLKQVP